MVTARKQRRKAGELKPVEKLEMRRYREVGMSIVGCADYFNVSVATAHRALAEMRKKFGPEKLPKHRRQFARPTLHKPSLNASDSAESSH